MGLCVAFTAVHSGFHLRPSLCFFLLGNPEIISMNYHVMAYIVCVQAHKDPLFAHVSWAVTYICIYGVMLCVFVFAILHKFCGLNWLQCLTAFITLHFTAVHSDLFTAIQPNPAKGDS